MLRRENEVSYYSWIRSILKKVHIRIPLTDNKKQLREKKVNRAYVEPMSRPYVNTIKGYQEGIMRKF